MKRGEIYWADPAPRSGSEEMGRRPMIVFSHDAFNQTPGWRSVIVVPVSTSLAQSRRGPTAVTLPAGAGGLPHDSVALCHQITTLDRGKLGELLGALDPERMHEVEKGIKIALDLP